MRGAERVIDINLLAARQFMREIAVVFFLFRMEAEILQQQRLARGESGHHPPCDITDTVGCQCDFLVEHIAEVFGDWLETQVGAPFFGSPQMRT